MDSTGGKKILESDDFLPSVFLPSKIGFLVSKRLGAGTTNVILLQPNSGSTNRDRCLRTPLNGESRSPNTKYFAIKKYPVQSISFLPFKNMYKDFDHIGISHPLLFLAYLFMDVHICKVEE